MMRRAHTVRYSFFANAVAAADPMMMRHYAQLCASLRLGRNQHAIASASSLLRAPIRNLTSSHRPSSGAVTATNTNPDKLPHYPLPALSDTLTKYLRSVKPLLSADEFDRTARVVNEFGAANGEGAQLHALLSQRASTSENWLADWWVKYAYLGFRAPVVVNSNPGLYYDVCSFGGVDAWLSHTARTVWATLRFKQQIDAKEIPADRMGKALLDMAQYGRIFGTCRIPRKDFDAIEFHPESDYVIVAFRNGFYKLPVYKGGQILTESELVGQLHEIVQTADADNPPIGALTAEQRDTLAVAYEHLNKTNRAAVQTIERSLFIVCLDQAVALQPHDAQTRYNVGSHQLIHGGGGAQNSANRWFDKTLQLIVNENGLIGLNYEHSPGEGQPIAVLSDFIISHTKANPEVLQPRKVAAAVRPTKLTFGVDAKLQKHLEAAVKHVDGLANNLDMHVLDFTAYGKNFIKSQKMSPDSYIQMAMQYAFYKKHGVPGAHYETAQQRMFIHGRTETIRSCSIESVAFAQAMCSPDAADADRVRLLRAAVNGHKDYTLMAMQGAGVDRLLMGLKLVARESDRKVPALYADESFVRSTHYRISTSQVASQHKAFMCYGPAVEDGYGICYNPRDADMLLAVSAFAECPETSARAMAGALGEALNDMYEVLVRAGGQTPASKL